MKCIKLREPHQCGMMMMIAMMVRKMIDMITINTIAIIITKTIVMIASTVTAVKMDDEFKYCSNSEYA